MGIEMAIRAVLPLCCLYFVRGIGLSSLLYRHFSPRLPSHSSLLLNLSQKRAVYPAQTKILKSSSSDDPIDGIAASPVQPIQLSAFPSPFSLQNYTYNELHFPSHLDYSNTTQIAYRGPSLHHCMMQWHEPPKRILFLAKPDPEILDKLFDSVLYLWSKEHVDIVFEENIFHWLYGYTPFSQWLTELKVQPGANKRLSILVAGDNSIDLVITFGGDGLLLHCNNLFNGAVPPVMCFDFGSLGFLTPFQYDDFKEEVDNVLNGTVVVTLRMRLECTVFRGELEKGKLL